MISDICSNQYTYINFILRSTLEVFLNNIHIYYYSINNKIQFKSQQYIITLLYYYIYILMSYKLL